MIQPRNIPLSIILTLITCGIYGIYWFIVLTDEVGTLSGDPDFTGLKHFLLTLVTCGIWSLVWAYQIGKHVSAIQYQRGRLVNDNSTIYLILGIFGLGIVTYALVQNEINSIV
ncbi:DUF4234 domain-containing protein [Paenibacillus septentrionalis]|uniref:DUF4234 domain-containing protein n=1 Tax=Paenibacillus septentrionalis TaxID=429342 RepID=A0ABW1V967_9BACL